MFGPCNTSGMRRDLERAVDRARRELAAEGYPLAAFDALSNAQRELAKARGEQWAEPLDLDVMWDSGAPLPHVVSNGLSAVLICFAVVDDAKGDGTRVEVADPGDPTPVDLLEFTFEGCRAIRFGGPNDEALNGHPLFERGLAGYGPHIVGNSAWIAEQEAINSVHPHHRGGWHELLSHYFFAFHDEVFEAVAKSVAVKSVRSTMRERVVNAANQIVA